MARQSGLGKGLGALIPGDDEGGGAEQRGPRLAELPITSIRPNSYQPRTNFEDEGLSALAASIRELGVLQPILVRRDGEGYELIAGERRWRAARQAGLSVIPAVVKSAEDSDSLEQALVENLHRADLNALEEAAAYQQLIEDFSLTHEQVAERVGKSRAAVTNTLRLLQLSPAIQRLVLEARISAGHARALLGTTDKTFQEMMARRITTEELSVRATEEAVRIRNQGPGDKAKGKTKSTAPREVRPAGMLELEEVLAGVLDTRVSIDLVPNRKGRLVIEFADINDLERIFRVMTVGTSDSP